MNWLFLENEETYTGRQLRSLWAYMNHDVLGDSIVAFVGPCDVDPALMCDMADAKAHETIRSAKMLHFIVEHFDRDLQKAVLCQRMLMAIAMEAIHDRLGRKVLRREGDDLYDGHRKLSVSIATASPVSAMIHAGMNIDPTGAPVPAVGIQEYRLDPREVAEAIMKGYAEEMRSAELAARKVKGVP